MTVTGSSVTVVMVMIELFEVSSHTLSKAAMSKGMSQYVYTVYSNALAILVLLLSTFIFYRGRNRYPSRISVGILCKIFIMGILSSCIQIFMNMGVRYSSPTLNSAISDVVPAFTFLIALICRMERLDLRLKSSQAKSFGTMVSIAGALLVTLYKGLPINGATTVFFHDSASLILSYPSNWIFGGICCTAAALFIALIYVTQVWILRDYPEEVMVTLITCIFVTGQSTVVALIAERGRPSVWKLKPDIELIAIVFSAILVVSFRSIVHAWACRQKGAVYTVAFKPLQIVIAVLLGVTFLGDTLYLGSVIGAIVLVSGFYAVIWGKSKEEKMVEDDVIGNSSLESSSAEAPLLREKRMDV